MNNATIITKGVLKAFLRCFKSPSTAQEPKAAAVIAESNTQPETIITVSIPHAYDVSGMPADCVPLLKFVAIIMLVAAAEKLREHLEENEGFERDEMNDFFSEATDLLQGIPPMTITYSQTGNKPIFKVKS